MYRKYLLVVLLLAIGSQWLQLSAQPPSTAEEYRKNYEWRIRQERLEGVYIPSDLGDAFSRLNQLIESNDKQRFIEIPDSLVARKLHFSLGRWIIHNWGFYEGSRLSEYMKTVGLTHPEDMAAFIIITYQRNLRNVPLDAKNLVNSMREDRLNATRQRLLKGTIIHESTRQLPPPDTLNGNGG